MEYLYLFLALIGLALILMILSNKRETVQKLQMRTLSDDDFTAGIRSKARALRSLSHGRGVNVFALSHQINKAIQSINRKNNANRPLFEHERWLYENFYLVR